LLKRAIGAASEKRGARMRVNEGPVFVSSSRRESFELKTNVKKRRRIFARAILIT